MPKDWAGVLIADGHAATVRLRRAGRPGLVQRSVGRVALGTSVDYTLNGIAYKTFISPRPSGRQATLSSLNRMGMTVVPDKKTETGWAIVATANGREIDVDLETLTRPSDHPHARGGQ